MLGTGLPTMTSESPEGTLTVYVDGTSMTATIYQDGSFYDQFPIE